MGTLILMRHGQSAWNQKNLFTGWVDIPLSEKGVQESIEGGKLFCDLPIDRIFTSTLIRSHMTLVLAMLQHKSGKIPVFQHRGEKEQAWGRIHSKETEETVIPVIKAWELNERMYGELQGQNKEETAKRFGKDQVQLWRRSFDTAPPQGESLAMTAERTLPYFQQEIVPLLGKGKNILICAHGNSIRSIVMHLEQLSKEEILHFELKTGESLFYSFSDGKYERLSR